MNDIPRRTSRDPHAATRETAEGAESAEGARPPRPRAASRGGHDWSVMEYRS